MNSNGDQDKTVVLDRNEELSAESQMQQEKLATIGQLAAGVAHELNNPLGFLSSNLKTLEDYLGILKSYIGLLEEKFLPDEVAAGDGDDLEEVRDFRDSEDLEFVLEDLGDLVSESRDGVDRMTAIVQKLRSFSRVDQDEKVEKYDLNKAVESALLVAGSEIQASADVTTELDKVRPISCKADEINLVLLNIILNATQSVAKKNNIQRGQVSIKTFQEERHVCCSVTDNGPGIPASIRDRIFDPFFTNNAVGSGTGLGLSISHNIVVNKHGGELSFETKENHGTTFTMKLPLEA